MESEFPKSFETKFSAAITKFNSLSEATELPQFITALMLLSNADVENSQRVSYLNTAAPNRIMFSEQFSNDAILRAVT